MSHLQITVFLHRDVLPDQGLCPGLSRVSESPHKENRGNKGMSEEQSLTFLDFTHFRFSPSFSLNLAVLCHLLYSCNDATVSLCSCQGPGGRGCVTKTMESHSDDMLSKLRSQREAGLFCDITLRTDGRSYSAHRAVLAAVSDHFQEIFTEMDSSIKADIDLTGKSRYLQANTELCSVWGGLTSILWSDWTCTMSKMSQLTSN